MGIEFIGCQDHEYYFLHFLDFLLCTIFITGKWKREGVKEWECGDMVTAAPSKPLPPQTPAFHSRERKPRTLSTVWSLLLSLLREKA